MGGPNILHILNKANEIYSLVCDQLLISPVTSSEVTLYYPGVFEDCPNCEMTEWGVSYRVGGSTPFLMGSCPQCGSDNCLRESEVTETIRLRVYSGEGGFNKSVFKKLGVSIDHPQGELFTIGSVDDLQKIKSCNYAVMFSDEEARGSQRYSLSSEPHLHGFSKNRYFYCFWERV